MQCKVQHNFRSLQAQSHPHTQPPAIAAAQRKLLSAMKPEHSRLMPRMCTQARRHMLQPFVWVTVAVAAAAMRHIPPEWKNSLSGLEMAPSLTLPPRLIWCFCADTSIRGGIDVGKSAVGRERQALAPTRTLCKCKLYSRSQ